MSVEKEQKDEEASKEWLQTSSAQEEAGIVAESQVLPKLESE